MGIRLKACRDLLIIGLVAITAGCASGPPPPAYPAFIRSDELPDVFMASLPGIRAKQFAEDAGMRSTSNRIDLPPDWQGTTGASPGKALEIFVLDGELRLADVTLVSGGYAYVPPGSLGFNLVSDDGARILYFLDNFDPGAMIRSPLILDSGLVSWQPTSAIGVFSKELRSDPGSGARTWLMRIDPEASIPWQSSSSTREGYLVSGEYQHSECVAGEPFTDIYATGGYFQRPAEAVNGGPEAIAMTETIWLLREAKQSTTELHEACVAD
jgi:quercetin dioxygenase-like cupin family protein